MLAFVPVRFDLYRPLKAHLRWTMQNLVAFADRAGRCFPSVRKLAEVVGLGKSSVSRHLAALEREGAVKRTRKPGGVYEYQIDSRFLPAARGVSHSREPGVPRVRTEEKTPKKIGNAPRFEDDKTLPRSPEWEPRLRGWLRSRFWLPQWGPRPDEPGCFAPTPILADVAASLPAPGEPDQGMCQAYQRQTVFPAAASSALDPSGIRPAECPGA